jgi:hypothetical protein
MTLKAMTGQKNRAIFGSYLLVVLLAVTSADADFRPEMKGKFYSYVEQVAKRVERETAQTDSILYLNTLPETERREPERVGYYARNLLEKSASPVNIDGAMVHHYLGGVFIPGKGIADVMRVVQDYDRHAEYYKPEVMRSKLLRRNGDQFEIYYRLHKKYVISATLDMESVVTYRPLSPTRVASHSRSRSVREVKDPGESDEKVLAEGQGGGWLWLIDTFWKFEARSGGVWVECEAISLTRDIPWVLRPLLKGTVASVSRESLEFTLKKTKEAVLKP